MNVDTTADPQHGARHRAAVLSALVGACFAGAAFAGFHRWEDWDKDTVCTGIFSDCFNQSIQPLFDGVAAILVLTFAALLVLRVRRAWAVLLFGLPCTGIAAIARNAIGGPPLLVVIASGASWGLIALVLSEDWPD